MEINTNPNSIVPLYAQIVESLKRDIENGVYNATERIPAEAELAKQRPAARSGGAAVPPPRQTAPPASDTAPRARR